MLRYLEALDTASDRVLLREHAVTHEGGRLVHALIGDSRCGDVEAVRSAMQAFADPRRGSLHLSGLGWPEAADRVARTAYLTREARGRGQVILFAADPTFRRSLPGLERLLLNTVVLGPRLGSSRTAPW